MSFNPLQPVTDYVSMLNRIFWLTTLSAVVATAILRIYFPAVDQLLAKLDFDFEIAGIKGIKLGYVVPALVVGGVTRATRFHDCVSSLFGIRKRFDVNEILLPLASESGFGVGSLSLKKLGDCRTDLMRSTFYRYASSTDPKIDKHLIYQALDR